MGQCQALDIILRIKAVLPLDIIVWIDLALLLDIIARIDLVLPLDIIVPMNTALQPDILVPPELPLPLNDPLRRRCYRISSSPRLRTLKDRDIGYHIDLKYI